MTRILIALIILIGAPCSAHATRLVCDSPALQSSQCGNSADWGYRYRITNAPFTCPDPIPSQANGSLDINIDDTPVGGPYIILIWGEWTCNSGWTWQATGKGKFRFSRTADGNWPYLYFGDRAVSLKGAGTGSIYKVAGHTGKIVVAQPSLTIDPWPATSFNATVGGSNPPDQQRSIQGLTAHNLSWTATVTSGSPEWLTVTPSAGTGNGTVTYAVDISGIVPKSITNGGAAVNRYGGYTGIPVVSHGYESGQRVIIAGTTNYDGVYSVDATSTANEIRVYKTYVAETFGAGCTIIQADSYKYVTFSAPGARDNPISAQIKLKLQPDPLVNGYSVVGTRNFTATAGGSNPDAQTIALTNGGGGVMVWTASVTTGAPEWLTVTPSSGTGDSTLTFSIDLTDMTTAGTYYKTATISAVNGSSTVSVTVKLTIS